MNRKKIKKRNQRDKVKYPNLQPRFVTKIRSEYLDYDYIDKLNDAEKKFLDKFTAEYHGASFTHTDADIQDYNKYGKDCNDRNNFANRDLYGNLKNKTNKKLVNVDTVGTEIENRANKDVDPKSMENAYVNFIESKEIEAMLQEYEEAMKNFTICE